LAGGAVVNALTLHTKIPSQKKCYPASNSPLNKILTFLQKLLNSTETVDTKIYFFSVLRIGRKSILMHRFNFSSLKEIFETSK